jgi:type VI protein secretion system component VasF
MTDTAPRGERRRVRVKRARRKPFLQSYWVWVIVLGVAAAAAVGMSYVLSQPEEQSAYTPQADHL